MPEIRITISKVDEDGKKAPSNKGKTKGEEKTSEALKQATRTALVNVGKQFASYGINQYGNLIGSKTAANQLNELSTLLSYSTQIATGGLVGVGAVAAQLGTSAINNFISTTKANQEAQMLMQRSGNANINGGRNTYD